MHKRKSLRLYPHRAPSPTGQTETSAAQSNPRQTEEGQSCPEEGSKGQNGNLQRCPGAGVDMCALEGGHCKQRDLHSKDLAVGKSMVTDPVPEPYTVCRGQLHRMDSENNCNRL